MSEKSKPKITEKDESLIPPGTYCYVGIDVDRSGDIPKLRTVTCPYWSRCPEKPSQLDGHCSYLNRSDDDEDIEGVGLLWDQVKECGINDDRRNEYDPNAEKQWLTRMLEVGAISDELAPAVQRLLSTL